MEEARAYFNKTDANGVSVYDHLTELLYLAIEENPENVANNILKLPGFSHEKKKNAFRPHEKRVQQVFRQTSEPDARIVKRAADLKTLFKKQGTTVATTIEQPTANVTITTTTVKPKPTPTFRSVIQEARYFELIGVGIPEQEALLLDLSIVQLAATKKLTSIRFFGKIFGTCGNYFIVESSRWYPDKDHKNYKEKHAMPPPPRKGVAVDIQPEPMGKGLNRYSYWVCPHPSASWTHLPDTTPQKVNAARQIKKYFTGNLDASITSYPEFPGKEIDYLRAQIARIASATTISPVGALQKHEEDDDEEEEEEEEEGAPKKPKEEKTKPLTDPAEDYPGGLEDGIRTLVNREQWCHHHQYIYRTGRATKVPEKELAEDEEEPEEEEDEENKPKEEEEKELLEPISKDKLFDKIILPKEDTGEEEEEAEPENEEGGEEKEEKEEEEEEVEEEEDDPLKKRIPAWILSLKNGFYRNHAVVMVKSLRWPGAYSYAAEGGKAWGNLYMGNGLKATARQYAPMPAFEIQKEADDIAEKEDPSAKSEKLLARGEELPDKDSEAGDEPEEEVEEGEEED